jgi:DNA/RNA endonuclease YhcR with UshA esterase domain
MQRLQAIHVWRWVRRCNGVVAFGVLLALQCVLPAPAQAHHSAALFYTMDKRITVKGEVARFSFRNPHAILELVVKDDKGETIRWTCETSAPSALRRRGWSQESIHAGDVVTIEGIPAVDGSRLMRIVKIIRADGTEVGVTGKLDD